MQTISIKNRNRDRQNLQMMKNSNSYQYYYSYLKMLATSMFKWENLPNEIPERFIERTLFYTGKLAFFYDNTMGFMVTKCNDNGSYNCYDEPVAYECYATNGYRKNVRASDCVIIRNNVNCVPTMVYADYFVHKLWEIDVAIQSNLSLQKFPIIATCEETQRLTIENLLKKVTGGEPVILGNKNLDLNSLNVLNMRVPFIADSLQEMKNNIFTECLSNFGINNANTTKKERLNVDEVNSNNQCLDLSSDNMLLFREQACEEIKEKFDIDISVSLREKRENSTTGGDILNE